MERVVITGAGILGCLGKSLDEVSAGLQEGRCPIVLSQERKARGFRSGLRTNLPEVDLKSELDRKARKFMPQAAIYAAVATNQAVRSSDLSRDRIARPDVGIIVGNDSSCETLPGLLETLDRFKETRFLGSNSVIKVMNSTVSMNLGPYLGAQGINITISSACSSGAHAIGHAFHLIRSGAQTIVFAGGAQEDHWLAMASFDAINAFSTHEDEPARAVRPFDKSRDGLVVSGGGCMLVVESLPSAKARGAHILGEIVSYGFSSDGTHLTLPSGDGAERCMRSALEHADLAPGDIDYISAHATGTELGDRSEAGAIHRIFGENGPPVSSTKSMTGHECWMAGASEALYCLLMFRDEFIAPNINFEAFDEQTPPINVNKTTQRGQPRMALSNSFGFGGTNASLILRRWSE